MKQTSSFSRLRRPGADAVFAVAMTCKTALSHLYPPKCHPAHRLYNRVKIEGHVRARCRNAALERHSYLSLMTQSTIFSCVLGNTREVSACAKVWGGPRKSRSHISDSIFINFSHSTSSVSKFRWDRSASFALSSDLNYV
jgi:hypothetical protein